MNYKVIARYLGQILIIFSCILLLPAFIGLLYGEFTHFWVFFVVMAIGLIIGFLPQFLIKTDTKKLRNKEALVIVGMAWVVLSLLGALPFVMDGSIPNYIDALFETISGFTTTGATVLGEELESMAKCMQFWRSLTHWLGGMGILVFILAVMPGTDGSTFHLFKFESPGPQVGKIAAKVRLTATILYLIYFALTVLEVIFLVFADSVDLFDAVTIAMSTAGTGGFANYCDSIAHFNSVYVEMVVLAFMFIFSLNFNIYYLLILKQFKVAFSDEELRFYVGYVVLAIVAIVINLCASGIYTFGEALRYTSFSVVSLTSSTGFATVDFAAWPQFSKNILMLCMLFGACAGSTGGGFKASRILILVKAGLTNLLGVLRPQSVQVVKLNKKMLSKEEIDGVERYLLVYILIFLIALIFISLENLPFDQTFTSILTCMNNDGPYFASAFAGYGGFSWLSKIVLMILMLIGRLEIFPVLLLFVPHTWKKRF